MKYNISKKVEGLKPSGIREFFDLVLGMPDVISLGVGEPDFITPWNICESAIFSLEQGYTTYTSNKGLYKLRFQISKYLKKRHNIEYDPDKEILITVGVSEAMDLAMRAIINPEDKILIPEPCYVSYIPTVIMAGGKPVIIPTQKSNFKLRPEDIKKYCDKKTRAIIFNYPTNPTGVSYTKRELQDIKRAVFAHNLLVISDEIYDELTYDFQHTPFPSLSDAKDKVLYLNGFSKAYAMTGWRIGYACGPEKIISAMNKIHQYTILCAPIMSQMAACEALRNSQRSVDHMKKEYKRRRNFVVEELKRLGLGCRKPDGAFYAFVNIKCTGLSSYNFAKSLLEKEKVAVVPGTAFGDNLSDYIRISYATSFDKLKEAFVRIERYLSEHKKEK